MCAVIPPRSLDVKQVPEWWAIAKAAFFDTDATFGNMTGSAMKLNSPKGTDPQLQLQVRLKVSGTLGLHSKHVVSEHTQILSVL